MFIVDLFSQSKKNMILNVNAPWRWAAREQLPCLVFEIRERRRKTAVIVPQAKKNFRSRRSTERLVHRQPTQ